MIRYGAKWLKWVAVAGGGADHPMNPTIRQWMPRQAAEAEAHFQAKYGQRLAEVFTDDKYQLMHIEMFPFGIIHAECLGGDIDLLLNQRVEVGCFPWRFVDGESCIARIVACLLYTSDAADERSSVDLGGRRIIKKTSRGTAEVMCSVANELDTTHRA